MQRLRLALAQRDNQHIDPFVEHFDELFRDVLYKLWVSVQKLPKLHVYLDIKCDLLSLLVVYQEHLLLTQQFLEVLERHYQRVRYVLLLLYHDLRGIHL